MKLFQRFVPLFLFLTLLYQSSLGMAQEVSGKKMFRFSSFGTLALTRGGDDNLGFRGDLDRESLFDGDWSFVPDSVLGLQMDMQFGDRLGGAVQFVGKDRAEDSLKNSLEWAFLRYRLSPDWTIRAGRMGTDLFMLSDYRNVGFAYLWTRPPPEFYTPLAFANRDGVDAIWSSHLGKGTLRAKLAINTSQSTISVADTLIDLELKMSVGATISWETEHWQLKFSASENEFGQEGNYFPGTDPLADALLQASVIWPEATAISERLKINKPKIQYYAVGASYIANPWHIQSEISYFASDMEVYPPSVNGYFSVGYQVGSVTPFILGAFIEPRKPRKVLPESPVLTPAPIITEQLAFLRQTTQTVFDSTRIGQRSVSTGLRWDLRYNLALKAQWDHSWIDGYSGGLWDIRSVPDTNQEIDTFSVNLNFVFR
ncbi:hypothetical protein FT643_19720 [Ketobacter sp. MCCC 1A13808]|uniref:hypothetical protein n=1 Tax=Ketobacter sp. MCCC 1A13808 TaxID=2602738 RepID=UPI0012EB3CD7|nr:hypothetical protein [Ketobacter sp. MCCC 1A13808]MVF14369.1 hypothetical protein [Ketobacter sp. MCCC 1A13808]